MAEHTHTHNEVDPGHADVHAPKLTHYMAVFATLMVLTAVTVMVAFVDLGFMNTPVALLIATIKAVCVILIFMHVYHSSKLTKLTVISGFFWLAIMVVLTMNDYVTRGFRVVTGQF